MGWDACQVLYGGILYTWMGDFTPTFGLVELTLFLNVFLAFCMYMCACVYTCWRCGEFLILVDFYDMQFKPGDIYTGRITGLILEYIILY